MKSSNKLSVEKIGQETVLLSLTEIGLGSIVHGFHLPFGGHLLSLNQGFLLSRFLVRNKTTSGSLRGPIEISNCSALLKSLSPMGKKLTPMLAISVQGLLFSFGPVLFGVNLLGLSLGMVLLSLWGFLQPLALYYLFFGSQLFTAALKLVEDVERFVSIPSNTLWIAILSLATLKAVLAVGVAAGALWVSEEKVDRYQSLLLRQETKRRTSSEIRTPLQATLRELLNPLFLLSLLLTAVFLFYSQSNKVTVVLGVLRPLAVAFVFFFCFHFFRIEKCFLRNPHSLLAQTFKVLREKTNAA